MQPENSQHSEGASETSFDTHFHNNLPRDPSPLLHWPIHLRVGLLPPQPQTTPMTQIGDQNWIQLLLIPLAQYHCLYNPTTRRCTLFRPSPHQSQPTPFFHLSHCMFQTVRTSFLWLLFSNATITIQYLHPPPFYAFDPLSIHVLPFTPAPSAIPYHSIFDRSNAPHWLTHFYNAPQFHLLCCGTFI